MAQFHVLAVDDSVIDRMLIERLLKTSSFHGNFFHSFPYACFLEALILNFVYRPFTSKFK